MKKALIIIVVGLIALFLVLSGAGSHREEWVKRNTQARGFVNIELTKRYEACNEKFPIRDKTTPPAHAQCIKEVEKDRELIEAKYNYASPEKSPRCESEMFVLGAAEKFVRDTLKAPSTAEFFNEKVIYTGDCEHQVTGNVDAQNGFGAKIRVPFAVRVKYIGEQYENDSGLRVKNLTPEIESGWRKGLEK